MKPRVTITRTPTGEIEIYMNPEGRDWLVKELLMLDERNDHFHLSASELGDVRLSTVAYGPADEVIMEGKVLFRPDEWDRQYSSHVLKESE